MEGHINKLKDGHILVLMTASIFKFGLSEGSALIIQWFLLQESNSNAGMIMF